MSRFSKVQPEITVNKRKYNNSTFDGSDAVNFIIERAHAPSDRPLIIYACGNLTNVALALLKDPTIAPKIEIWWLGTEWPQNYACNNHAGDLDAVDALLANPQNVPFNIIPWPHLGVTFVEIRDRMTGRGPQVSPAVPGLRGEGPDFTCFGDYSVYLFDRFVGARQKERGRSLLDVLGFAAVKSNVGKFTPYEMGAPSFVVEEESETGSQAHRYPGTWVENDDNARRVTIAGGFARSGAGACPSTRSPPAITTRPEGSRKSKRTFPGSSRCTWALSTSCRYTRVPTR
jgi:hypothetical protein